MHFPLLFDIQVHQRYATRVRVPGWRGGHCGRGRRPLAVRQQGPCAAARHKGRQYTVQENQLNAKSTNW